MSIDLGWIRFFRPHPKIFFEIKMVRSKNRTHPTQRLAFASHKKAKKNSAGRERHVQRPAVGSEDRAARKLAAAAIIKEDGIGHQLWGGHLGI